MLNLSKRSEEVITSRVIFQDIISVKAHQTYILYHISKVSGSNEVLS